MKIITNLNQSYISNILKNHPKEKLNNTWNTLNPHQLWEISIKIQEKLMLTIKIPNIAIFPMKGLSINIQMKKHIKGPDLIFNLI